MNTDCLRVIENDEDYPALLIALADDNVELRDGSSLDDIELLLQSTDKINRILVLVGSQGVVKGFIPTQERGHKDFVARNGSFRIVSVTEKLYFNPDDLETSETPDYILAGNKLVSICDPDPCSCAESISLVKIPVPQEV